jgi:WxcM-like protein
MSHESVQRFVQAGSSLAPAKFRPEIMNPPTEARLIELPRHARADGEVIVAEAAAHVPFRIERMFTLVAPAGAKRGRHAHRLCSQFMICVSGAVNVVCEDGSKKSTFAFNRRNQALPVPPGLWNTVQFRQNESVLIVLRDRVYEAHDYIHGYDEFLSFREAVRA